MFFVVVAQTLSCLHAAFISFFYLSQNVTEGRGRDVRFHRFCWTTERNLFVFWVWTRLCMKNNANLSFLSISSSQRINKMCSWEAWTVITLIFTCSDQNYYSMLICLLMTLMCVCLCVSSGLSDIPGEAMVKLYCPKCMDVYTPKSSRHHHTDGAYFGTGFPHMLFMVHPEYRPKRPANQFVPRFVPSCAFYFLREFVQCCFPELKFLVTSKSFRIFTVWWIRLVVLPWSFHYRFLTFVGRVCTACVSTRLWSAGHVCVWKSHLARKI